MPPVLHRNAAPPVGKRREPLEIDVEKESDTCVVRISGPFRTGVDADYLLAKMGEITQLNCVTIVADFARVTSIGSEALSFIVGLYRFSGGRLVILKPQPQVSEVLGVTRLDRIIAVAADMNSAITLLDTANSATLRAASGR